MASRSRSGPPLRYCDCNSTENHGDAQLLMASVRDRRCSTRCEQKAWPLAPNASSARPQSTRTADPDTTQLGQRGKYTGDELGRTGTRPLRRNYAREGNRGSGREAAHLGGAVVDVERSEEEGGLALVVEE